MAPELTRSIFHDDIEPRAAYFAERGELPSRPTPNARRAIARSAGANAPSIPARSLRFPV
jgi:hypothetical protein